jgi:hypothetical protein
VTPAERWPRIVSSIVSRPRGALIAERLWRPHVDMDAGLDGSPLSQVSVEGILVRHFRSWFTLSAFLLASLMPLAGCGLVAAPCRVGSAALKIVPLAGQVAAAPTDACADVIDPTPTKS